MLPLERIGHICPRTVTALHKPFALKNGQRLPKLGNADREPAAQLQLGVETRAWLLSDALAAENFGDPILEALLMRRIHSAIP